MKRLDPLRRVSLCALGWGLLLSLSIGSAQTLEVVDDRGVLLRLPQSPKRIVSLLPSLSETVCALGECQRLVGVDRFSNFPLHLSQLPQVGGGLDPSIESIVALKPDLVMMAVSSRASDRLEALGIKVMAFQTQSHADVRRTFEKIGQLLEVRDAQRVWRLIDAGVTAAAQSLPASIGKVRVYFEVNRGPYAAGESSFIGETLTRLGVKNIVPKQLGPFPRLNPEFVVRANPDVIMISLRNQSGLLERPGWSGLRALRENRVCVFSSEESDFLVRPGPRMAEAARLMARCLSEKAH